MTAPAQHPTRRCVLAATGVGAATLALPGPSASADPGGRVGSRVRDVERRYECTVGLWASDGRGRAVAHRADEPRPIASVFKLYAAAAVLRDLDRHGEVLERRIRYTEADLVEGAPVTGDRIEEGMTVGELCDAAVRYSDNVAGNLLLDLLGGPPAITRFARSLGDRRTRLDRREPDLNEALPGDPRDTTTARASGRAYRDLLVGGALAPFDRGTLLRWALANTTSDARFRAVLPRGWRLADKTGTGERGVRNDVGVLLPPRGEPVVVSALIRLDDPDSTAGDASLAELAEVALAALRSR